MVWSIFQRFFFLLYIFSTGRPIYSFVSQIDWLHNWLAYTAGDYQSDWLAHSHLVVSQVDVRCLVHPNAEPTQFLLLYRMDVNSWYTTYHGHVNCRLRQWNTFSNTVNPNLIIKLYSLSPLPPYSVCPLFLPAPVCSVCLKDKICCTFAEH